MFPLYKGSRLTNYLVITKLAALVVGIFNPNIN
jgi:hypothetical protein